MGVQEAWLSYNTRGVRGGGKMGRENDNQETKGSLFSDHCLYQHLTIGFLVLLVMKILWYNLLTNDSNGFQTEIIINSIKYGEKPVDFGMIYIDLRLFMVVF